MFKIGILLQFSPISSGKIGGVADESAKECKIYTSGGQINKMLPNRKNLHLQGFLCIAE